MLTAKQRSDPMNLFVLLGIWILRFTYLKLDAVYLNEILLRFDWNGEIQLVGEVLVQFNCPDCNLNDDWLYFGLPDD